MKWFDKAGYLTERLPAECVEDCSQSGSVDDHIDYWLDKLDFEVPRKPAEQYLGDYGYWDDLQTCSDRILAERVLWVGCSAINEEDGEWLGLIH